MGGGVLCDLRSATLFAGGSGFAVLMEAAGCEGATAGQKRADIRRHARAHACGGAVVLLLCGSGVAEVCGHAPTHARNKGTSAGVIARSG